jgi:hypothetical protein
MMTDHTERAREALGAAATGNDCRSVELVSGPAVEIISRGYDTTQVIRLHLNPLAAALAAAERAGAEKMRELAVRWCEAAAKDCRNRAGFRSDSKSHQLGSAAENFDAAATAISTMPLPGEE